jgi:hypothetical protein
MLVVSDKVADSSHTYQCHTERAEKFVESSCQLHNFCIDNREPYVPLKCIYEIPKSQQSAYDDASKSLKGGCKKKENVY